MRSKIAECTENLKSSFGNQSEKIRDGLKGAANTVGEKWSESSTLTKVVVVGSVSVAAVAAPLAIIPVLNAVGFTSAGVAGGSFAASMQTATTASGSLFALCQSAGATGIVATSTSVGVGLTAGGIAASGIAATACRTTNNDQANNETGHNDSNQDDQCLINDVNAVLEFILEQVGVQPVEVN